MFKKKLLNNQQIIIICILGLMYGGFFYPIYSEFLEFGQTLAGKVKYNSDNLFYQYRDVSPSLLYIISKNIALNFDDIELTNIIISAVISLLSFVSVYLVSEKLYPNGRFNFLIPIGLTSIFFPNYFLYPLWFPTNFFVWGQIGFYLFLLTVALSQKAIYLRPIAVLFVSMCHPVYGALSALFLLFENFYLRTANIKNVFFIIASFSLGIFLITSDHAKVYLEKDKIVYKKEIMVVKDKEVNSSSPAQIINKNLNKEKIVKINLSNAHSPFYHGDFQNFIIGIISIASLPIIMNFVFKYKVNLSVQIRITNLFLLFILILSLISALSSYIVFLKVPFIIESYPYIEKIFGLVDRAAPNRILNFYFLLIIIVILNELTINKAKYNFFTIVQYAFFFLFLLPIPVYITPYFWIKPYPSIVEATLITACLFVFTMFAIKFITEKNLKFFFVDLFNRIVQLIATKIIFSGIVLFCIVGLGSIFIKIVNIPIGPKYFVSFHKDENSLKKYLKLLPKTGSILTSYGVHGVRGMNIQQKSGLDYILPSQNLTKYVFKDKLKSVGCYDEFKKNIDWGNVKDFNKVCFEAKTKKEWNIIFKKFNIVSLIVPSSFNINLPIKISDGVFSIY